MTKIVFFNEIGSRKINVLIIICNIIFYIFIDQLTSYFFLTKNVETIPQPFSIQWGCEQFCLKTTNNAHLNTTLGTSNLISVSIHKVKCYTCS